VTDDFPIRVEQRGAVAVWTLDRPDRMNALSRAMLEAIGKLSREAATNASVRAVVVTGAGDKAFCAGADLKERRTMSDEDVRALLDLYRSELGPLDRLPKPVVAALNGVAFGGGLELALACDLRVCAEGAEMGLTEVRLGIIPGAGGTQRLPRLIGEARAKEMILLGRRISAAQALAWGLVHQVVPRDKLRATVDAMLAELAGCAPLSVASAKSAIEHGYGRSLEDGMAIERESYEVTLFSEDRDEGLAAFAEGRPPRFRGR
jgi:methylglutaconyl-CoA hydratase